LISYIQTPGAESLTGFTGSSGTPVGYGFLPNFPIPNFKIYHVPASRTNIISLDQLCITGGSYHGNDIQLRVWDSSQTLLSDTRRQTNGVHVVPMKYIAAQQTAKAEINASVVTYSSSLQLGGVHYTREQLVRMKIVYDIHVFFLHLSFATIKNAIAHHALGPGCTLVPADVDRLVAHIGRCAICDKGKMHQISMTTPSTTLPAETPGLSWSLDIQPLPKNHHGGFTYALTATDAHSGILRVFGTIGKYTETSLMPAVIELLSFCLSHGRMVRFLVPDSEACLTALKISCGTLGMQVLPVPPKEQAHAVERSTQTMNNLVTCTIASMPQKFKPEYTLYARQAAAAAMALVPVVGKDPATCPFTIFTESLYEYHAEYPYLPFGCTALSEVGVAHREQEASKTGFAYNNTPKSELSVNFGPDLYGTQKGCYRFLIESGRVVPRRNFEPVNAIMTGWEPNTIVRQSQKQFQIVESVSDKPDSLVVEEIIISSDPVHVQNIVPAPLPLDSNTFKTVLKPTEISVPDSFYSVNSNSSGLPPTRPEVESPVIPAADTLPSQSAKPDAWTQVVSKRDSKLSSKNIVPYQTRTRQSSNNVVNASLSPSQKICFLVQTSILKLKKDIQTEFSLNQALKLPHIASKIPAAVAKEIGKIGKFNAGETIKREDIPKGAVFLYFLMRIKEKMRLDGELDPQVNARLCIDGLRQKRDYPNASRETFCGTPNMAYFIILIALVQFYVFYQEVNSFYWVYL
jgi:hypothetical protein